MLLYTRAHSAWTCDGEVANPRIAVRGIPHSQLGLLAQIVAATPKRHGRMTVRAAQLILDIFGHVFKERRKHWIGVIAELELGPE